MRHESQEWLQNVEAAIMDLETTVKERRARIAAGTAPANASWRLNAMLAGLRILKVAEAITYFETNGRPTTEEMKTIKMR